MATDALIYLDDYADEVTPCAPTLEALATWLSKPAPDWNRPTAAVDGEEFAASQIIVLADVRAEWRPDGWHIDPAPPAAATYFFLRWHEGSPGWNAEQSGETPEAALEYCEADDGALWLACTKDGPNVRVRYEAAGPRVVILGEVQ